MNIEFKQIAKNSKGMNIKWEGNYIFPSYSYNSGSVASTKRINRAKKIVISILKNNQKIIENAFKQFAKKRYGNNVIITYDFNTAINKVENTRLGSESEFLNGESDDTTIWISKNKISDDYLVGTILHESLHYLAKFNNKDICEKDEHYIMSKLGEDIN